MDKNATRKELQAKVEKVDEKVEKVLLGGAIGILSNPPVGKKKVTNLYWDPVTQEIVVDKEE